MNHLFNYLTQKEYKELKPRAKREYQKEYRTALNEAKIRLLHAREFTPHKIEYYKEIVIKLVINAPFQTSEELINVIF